MQTRTVTRLWQQERQLWTGDSARFARRLSPACLMAFPDGAILRGAEILRSLSAAPRWQAVEMHGQRLSEHHGAVVLAYRARARHAGRADYDCLCTSCWVPRDGVWQMIQHHQAPLAA
ncbi:nuclear transport factor 2 family protein [Pseudooceanicola sp. CBS1P-1]|uniref:DUF4440 domain-containing protein n=1 Tax=Pseudooceanicola albus TaxID=2692189 RepID=A0A6L7G9S2_9RHOB|nr:MULTISPECIES: nuclear transport factor 2 family protein [Pseudooceanicola]MBT9382930.1 nuclear transport factor 2 family protein [Pseudooceanicola endophyticus]MXN20146.1 DUF4440 domain-containing protein [Pseudooceanicola albus]